MVNVLPWSNCASLEKTVLAPSGEGGANRGPHREVQESLVEEESRWPEVFNEEEKLES